MILERFEVPGLAHYSYLLASQGQAVVIDPKRDFDTYTRYAEEKDLSITHDLETHIHADYVSGAKALSEATGAELWLSCHDEGQGFSYQFHHHPFRDGEKLALGDLRIVALHTPGHTPEHLSFLAFEQSRCGQPMVLFSGDLIFVGSLGRPDLLGEEAKRKLAKSLYKSVHEKIANLPDGVEIYPAHGAGSLCGAGMSQRPQSTLGYERFCNVFLSRYSEQEFVECILASVPEFPDYYQLVGSLKNGMKAWIEAGFEQAHTPQISVLELDRRLHSGTSLQVLDVRSPEEWGDGHIRGAQHIPGGTLPERIKEVAHNNDLYVVCGSGYRSSVATSVLERAGHTRLFNVVGGMNAWKNQNLPISDNHEKAAAFYQKG